MIPIFFHSWKNSPLKLVHQKQFPSPSIIKGNASHIKKRMDTNPYPRPRRPISEDATILTLRKCFCLLSQMKANHAPLITRNYTLWNGAFFAFIFMLWQKQILRVKIVVSIASFTYLQGYTGYSALKSMPESNGDPTPASWPFGGHFRIWDPTTQLWTLVVAIERRVEQFVPLTSRYFW